MDMEYRICKRCVMDTTDPAITFDQQGVCNHCTAALERYNRQILDPDQKRHSLEQLAEVIKAEGKGKEYDCIIGVSGGVDSSTTAYYVKKLGLRPLAIHFDNGWNSELAVDNVKRTLETLDIELHTHVVDWEEFKDLQLSFLKASVANCEAPTDHGITALLFSMAHKVGTRFILSGSNLATESIMPLSWGHYNQDLKFLKSLHKRFGSVPLKTMPLISLGHYFYYVFVRKIRQIPFLNYIDYDKDKAKLMLAEEIGWRDYGGKHYESVWTRFFQGYYLPTKFGFDKRKAHCSSMIVSGLMSREQALEELEKPIYEEQLLREDMQFVLKKFGLSQQEWDNIMAAPPKTAMDYPSNLFILHNMQNYKDIFRKIATRP